MPVLTTPNTFVAGTDAIAAQVNANFDAIATFLNTTKLDAANLQDGAVTEVKIADDAVKHTKLGTLPTARVSRSTTQSIPNNTATDITFNTEDWDTDTMFTAPSTTITIKTAGKWRVWCSAIFDSNGVGGVRSLAIVKNGTATLAASGTGTGALGNNNGLTTYVEVTLAINDTLTFNLLQGSNSALNIIAGAAAGATWIRD